MTSNDMAKIASARCAGCGACCRDMGDSIRLDPLDVHELVLFLHLPFSGLLEKEIALHVEDGLILPHLKMQETTGACIFLGEDGCCGIHEFRPGLCRLFPLGRDYDGTSFKYFIVENGCPLPDKSKVKISRWLEISDLPAYEKFVSDWHFFTKDLKTRIASMRENAADGTEAVRKLNLQVLNTFYGTPCDPTKDFYKLFSMRLLHMRRMLKL